MTMTLSKKQHLSGEVAENAKEAGLEGGTLATSHFEALFQRHWGRIFSVVLRLVGDPAEAEDLASEAFVQLYRTPPQRNDNPAGWLYRVATNLGLNAIRSRYRRQRYEQEAYSLAVLHGDVQEDPAEVVEKAQERQKVRRALSRLKSRSAQLLMWRYAGLSYAELAQLLDVSPESIGALLVRAQREFEKSYRELEG